MSKIKYWRARPRRIPRRLAIIGMRQRILKMAGRYQ